MDISIQSIEKMKYLFDQDLISKGYQKGMVRKLPAGLEMQSHTHPFDVRAMVLWGELTLTVDGKSFVYIAGDLFEMPKDCPHHELCGSEGVHYIYGRKG
jgi:quercetin dioxygenase-like cupin family protein